MYVNVSLKKSDKWLKMSSQEEYLTIIIDFLEKPDVKLLVIYVDPEGELVPIDTFPTTTKQKVQTNDYY